MRLNFFTSICKCSWPFTGLQKCRYMWTSAVSATRTTCSIRRESTRPACSFCSKMSRSLPEKSSTLSGYLEDFHDYLDNGDLIVVQI